MIEFPVPSDLRRSLIRGFCIVLGIAQLFGYLGYSRDVSAEQTDRPIATNVLPNAAVDLGFTCPEGFVVETVAGDQFVHDVYSMTTDHFGNPVVSGPGYIRTLSGQDESGIYTKSIDLKANIVQGAQGLWCEPGKYFFVADAGLWVVSDSNGDMVADGPGRKLLDLPTGGEHDAHAIRRGPDGWWYLIAGNFASNIGELQNDADAPIAEPRAGTLWRISPDFSKRGVWAHGLRNAYDFDFLADGSVVTYDSDEERELTLPWYRQTRVSILTAGSDAGWLDSAWSDLGSRVTMPHVLARLGRGSPTGVKVYDHYVFPKKYHNATFVLDWTFGRVLAIYPQPKDSSDKNQLPDRLMAETFLQTTGTRGFAPTDITIAPDGSLLVCSGGRGTTGTLYRIRYEPSTLSPLNRESGDSPTSIQTNLSGSQTKSVSVGVVSASAVTSPADCLKAPSPLEAWSRAKWEPIWKDASSAERLSLISDSKTSMIPSLQRRAIQYEVDLGNREAIAFAQRVPLEEFQKLSIGFPQNVAADKVTSVPPAAVRQAAWWAIGHMLVPNTQISKMVEQLSKSNPGQLETWFDSDDFGIESRGTLADDSTHIEHLVGEPVIRAFYECIGLRRGALPEASLWQLHKGLITKPIEFGETIPGKNDIRLNRPRSADTQRSVRQVQLWAAYRSQPSRADEPSVSQSEELALDILASVRLYGPNLGTIDAKLMDQLARRCANNAIPITVPDVLEAIAILQSILGDYRHSIPTQQPPPTVEAIDGYRSLYGKMVPSPLRDGWAKWCMIMANSYSKGTDEGALPPSNQPLGTQAAETWKATVVLEAMRAIAMLEPSSPEVLSFCFQQITASSHPTSDVHALITLACCHGTRSPQQTEATCEALTGILSKVRSLSLNTESRWVGRLEEIWKRLVAKDPQLPIIFASRPGFGIPGDLFWLRQCTEQVQSAGRLRFKETLLESQPKDWNLDVARFVWSDLKTVDSRLNSHLRKHAHQQKPFPSALELELMAGSADETDYESFLSAMESGRREQLRLGWAGLSLLKPRDFRREFIVLTSLWNQLKDSLNPNMDPKSVSSRVRAVAIESAAANLPNGDTWNDWEPFLREVTGDAFPSPNATSVTPSIEWRDRVTESSKITGDSDRGRVLYEESKCASCHGGGFANPSNALGPSLTGVSKRFSTEDLFQALFEPNKNISDRYRATKVLTTDGSIHIGMKIYESVDGITLQLANGTLSRINQVDIEENTTSDQSLMPAGLIDGLTPIELADLQAYLSSM